MRATTPTLQPNGLLMARSQLAVLLVAVAVFVAGGEFKPYPGARTEPWLESYRKQANQALKRIGADQPDLQMWITDDSYEKVRAFYAKLGAEDAEFGAQVAKPLSDSTERSVRATYFIFDGAASAVLSGYYVAIQRPVVVAYHPLDVRDVTVISLYKKP